MTSVSNKQISKPFRANRPNWLQWLGRTLLSIWGWKVLGSIKEEYGDKNLVIVVAPVYYTHMTLPTKRIV